MAYEFRALTDDVIVQEGTFGFTFTASGTIHGGQLVKPYGPMQVIKCTASTDKSIGVAAYYVTKGEAVTVYGPGNIVRTRAPSGVAVGADLYACIDGFVDDSTGIEYGGDSPCVGISLDPTTSGSIRMLVK